MEYLFTLVILIGLYVMLSASFNLIIGYGGLVSIAHPVFYAIGAYASALLARDYGVPVLIAMALAALIAGITSVLLALPSLRVSGDYRSSATGTATLGSSWISAAARLWQILWVCP